LPQAMRAALVRLETRRTSYLDVVPWIVACFAEKSTGTAAVTFTNTSFDGNGVVSPDAPSSVSADRR